MLGTDTTTSSPHHFSIPLPRPLWMGLATVALIVAGVGLRIGVPAYWQQALIREIERLGGRVETDPRGPRWIRNLVGDQRMKLFDEVVKVDLFITSFAGAIDTQTPVSDATLGCIGRLNGLKFLRLSNTTVTDSGVARLAGLTRLESLSLAMTQVTDGGLVHLKGMTGLKRLYLSETHVTDAGLSQVKGLTNLDLLWINDTLVTDSGVVQLKGLTKLAWLILSNTQVTDKGLAHIQLLPSLRLLDLENTTVTDAAVEKLELALPALRIER